MSKERRKEAFRTRLLEWNKVSNCRNMPWKGEKNPYLIWLSEVILQQTRVEQGLEYYHNFKKAFPTINHLASAEDEQVFKMWEGLGYYSRCRNLLHTARYIAFELNGRFPERYEEILKLKGIGKYTAAAIASFAYGLPYAVLDGNVFRVLSRYEAIETPVDAPGSKELFSQLADSLLCKQEPAAFNQAIMDLGATVCTPRNPSCHSCPLNSNCLAFKKDKVDVLPVKSRKLVRRKRFFNYMLVESEKGVLVRKRDQKDIWKGLYELVLIESEDRNLVPGELREHLPFYFTENDLAGEKEMKQQLTHQEINSRFYHIRLRNTPECPGYTNVPPAKIKELAFPVSIREFLASVRS